MAADHHLEESWQDNSLLAQMAGLAIIMSGLIYATLRRRNAAPAGMVSE